LSESFLERSRYLFHCWHSHLWLTYF